jgi:hypothetical protein
MSESPLPRLLVVGGPDSGKTTYRGQFILRLEHKPGQLKLNKSVENRTLIESETSRLAQGLQVMHTNADTYHNTSLEIGDTLGRPFILDFADYGGEQVRRMASSNMVPNHWVELVRNASAWLFFLRLDKIRPTKSFMDEKVQSAPQGTHSAASPKHDSASEIGVIEILQRLLFLRGASLQYSLQIPRLAVALSCWDEIPESERKMKPEGLLMQRAPLLASFLQANWDAQERMIFALSSTEEPLLETEPNEAFLAKGAENVGYIRMPDGSPTDDLTLPIAWLMQGPS